MATASGDVDWAGKIRQRTTLSSDEVQTRFADDDWGGLLRWRSCHDFRRALEPSRFPRVRYVDGPFATLRANQWWTLRFARC